MRQSPALRYAPREMFIHAHPDMYKMVTAALLTITVSKDLETTQMFLIGEHESVSMLTDGTFYSSQNELTRATCNTSVFLHQVPEENSTPPPRPKASTVHSETALLLCTYRVRHMYHPRRK